MAETRRHSTRNRGEPPLKLRKSPDPPKPGATSPPKEGRKAGRPRKSDIRETPTKSTKPLAKTKTKDSPKPATPGPEAAVALPDVVEDMSTLIEKSRQRWLNEGGIFEKFWTRPPRKKKGEPVSNLPTKSQMNMMEIGTARLLIDPHVFDITIWGVKKPALTWQAPVEASGLKGNQTPTPSTPAPALTSAPAGPPPRPVPQNPYVRPPPGTPSQTTPIQPANPRGLAPNPYAMPLAQSQSNPVTTQAPAQPQQLNPTQPRPSVTPSQTPAPSTSPNVATPRVPPPPPNAPQQQAPQQQTGTPHPDPVIQMLAQRAAGDPALKELMKVVAAGSESPEKLAEFQRHINEITEIVKQQQAKGQKFVVAQPQAQSQQGPASKQQPRATPYLQSKPPAPVRTDFTQLAFDFARLGDCYLFPSRSIIQHIPEEATTLISFLFTCKGKDVPNLRGGTLLKPEVEYYQPVTIKLLTTKDDIRTALSQVVGQPEQVAKEMAEIMERCTLAPDAAAMIAAASIPSKGDKRDRDGNKKAIEALIMPVDVDNIPEDDVMKIEWEAPDSLLPL